MPESVLNQDDRKKNANAYINTAMDFELPNRQGMYVALIVFEPDHCDRAAEFDSFRSIDGLNHRPHHNHLNHIFQDASVDDGTRYN